MTEGNGRRRERQRKAQIVVAATDYVIEHGLTDLSLRSLAEGLGTSHRMLLYHFGSKEQLFGAILREARQRERLRVVARPGEVGELPPLAEVMLASWQYLSGPSEDLFWRFYFELHGIGLRNPERYDNDLEQGVADWLATIGGLLAAYGYPEERATTLATLILAAFRGLILDLLTTGDRARADAAYEELIAAVEGLQGARDTNAREER